VLIKNVVLSLLKVGILVPFIFLGGYGIFSSWAVAIVITIAVSFFLLPAELREKFRVQIFRDELRKMTAYSTGNYFAGLVGNLSVNAIPIILTVIAGPQNTAYYAVAMSYASLLFSIPVSVCNSLFAEGSADEQRIREATTKTIKLIGVLLLPAISVLMIFGRHALLFFGIEYANHSTVLLSMLALSSIFVSINTVCWTLLNLKHRVVEIMIALSLNAFVILTLTFLWTRHGLTGTGLAWIVGQGITSLVYLLFTLKYLHVGRLMYRGTQS